MNNNFLLLIPVLLPIVAGILVSALNMKARGARQGFLTLTMGASTVLAVIVLLTCRGQSFTFARLGAVSLTLFVDELSVVSGLLFSILWFLTTLYAFGYMSHEENEVRFFTFFAVSMGIAVGLALAANPITYYFFFELLTFVTFPIIVHEGDEESVAAGRKYLLYSIPGAVLVLVSAAITTYFSAGDSTFAYGGTLAAKAVSEVGAFLQFACLLGFLGFGVKSAVFPLHAWLPAAYVAPTPVTALLHAVAVVKAGVFGVLRLVYYTYGFELIKGTYAQYIPFALVCITIVYGSVMALRTSHLKKRLAYSTVSHLSYVLLAAFMLSKQGLQSALVYMVFHAIIKITLFFCCGSVMFMTGTTDVSSMAGYGRKMKATFICFIIAALGLCGVPPTAGFFGKWYIGLAAFGSGNNVLGTIGIVIMMISMLLTCLYLLPFAARSFALDPLSEDANCKDPPFSMKLPVALIAVLIIVFGVAPGLLTNFIQAIG